MIYYFFVVCKRAIIKTPREKEVRKPGGY